ncbi:MAG: AEC family transporter [Bacteroidales bacterium]|jgi:predicted permease|nr:AEC family transporter [Bacteroidales bacterium]
MEAEIVVTQIFTLAVVVIIGVLAARFRVLTNESKDVLSKVIFNISLPLMLFTNFFTLEATPRLISNSITVLGLTGFVILLLFFSGWTASRIFRLKGAEAAIFKAHSMFGNTIFLGFPLITSLYGTEGLLYASMFQLVSSIIMWTGGVIILSHGNGTSWKRSLMKVFNPNTVATLAGLLFFLIQVRLPDIIIKPMAQLGSANTWLSMLYIGALMSFSSVGGLIRRKSVYLLSLNRLVLLPAVLIALFYFVGVVTGVTPDKLVSSVIILEASMPCMATVVIMAKEFGSDDTIAVANVFVSTLLSILTLPLVAMALNRFM